jgi:transposase-like protein
MRSIPNPRDTWTPEDARRLFEEHRRTGGPLAEFARRHGITPARLYWWKKRLDAEPSGLTALSLVPATVTTTTPDAAAITIRLPNGIGIEATSATPAWIAEVVAELSRSS